MFKCYQTREKTKRNCIQVPYLFALFQHQPVYDGDGGVEGGRRNGKMK